MPLTAFGKLLASNPSSFPDSDQIAVGKHFVYIMQKPTSLQYANKKTLALVGSVTISISVTDGQMPGMVWWDNKIYLPDNSGNLYYLNTDPNNGIPNPTLKKIATLSNFAGTNNQLGFDFARKLIVYKQALATTAYYIDPNNPSKIGIYATASGTNFAGSVYSSNFFVDGESYMYVGIGDSPKPDVRILKPIGALIPIQYVLYKDFDSTAAATGGKNCDGLYPDPFDNTVIYTSNDAQPLQLYNVVGELSLKSISSKNSILSCDNYISIRQFVLGILVITTLNIC